MSRIALYQADGATHALAASPLIRAQDRVALRDAHAVLDHIRQIQADAAVAAQQAEQAAYAKGLADAAVAAEARITDALSSLSQQIADDQARRDAQIADAAFAALRVLVGSFDEGALTAALARHAAQQRADDATVIEVGAAQAPAVEKALADVPHTAVDARDDLPPLAVRVRTRDGRIIADLDVQLDNIASRWGVGMAGPDTANDQEDSA